MEIPPIVKSSVPKSYLKKKGDLATVTDDGQLYTLSVGPDGTILTADSAQSTGFKWVPGNGSIATWGDIAGTLSSQSDLENALNGKEPANANIQGHIAATGNPHGTTKAEIGLGCVTDDAQIPKSVATAKGSLIGFSSSGTPVEIPVGADDKILTADSMQPFGVAWKDVPGGTGAWGSITGTLSNQNDLQTTLNNKSDVNHTHTSSQVGLSSVTNNKQVKAAITSVDSNLVAWSGTTGDTVADSGKKISDLALATHNHNEVYEPANANIQSHISSTVNPHNVTAGQVLPDQSGKNGKFLTSNGATVSWGDPSAGTPPTGNGFRHVTDGAEDSAAKLVADADVAPAAAIAESKLSLNYPTHPCTNDLAAEEKAALAGTSGTPGAGNPYVTDADPRNTNARPPSAHGSMAHAGTIGTPSQVGLGNVTNDAQVRKAPASIDSNLVAWSGTTGDTVADSGKKISDLALASHNHNEVYEPANANIQSHISSTANPHNVTAGQVLPDQIGKNGKFLTSNGATVSWGDPSAGTPPTGNGFRHVTDGAEDPAAKLVADGDVGPAAAIAESKLSLNYPTHPCTNDPAAEEKAALAGTSGTPGAGNPYVTDADPRNTNARPPSAHGSMAHAGTIGTPSQVGLGNVPNIDATNPVNISQDETHRFVTDVEKSAWDNKQNALGFNPVPDTRTIAGHALTGDVTISNVDVGLGSVTNDAQIPKSLGTTKGDLIAFSIPGIPSRLPVGSDTYVLTADSTQAIGIKWAQAPGGISTLEIPTSDLSYSGLALTGIAGESLAFGDVVYQKATDGKLYKAKADAVGTMAAAGITVVGGTGTVSYIDNGYIRNDAWSWTVGSSAGGKVYVSPATAGLITQTAPNTVGEQLQELGYAEDAHILRIAVNSTLVEIGSGLTDLVSEVTGVLPETNGGAGAVSGILKANGSGVVSAAAAGTDYVAPGGTNIRVPHAWTMLDGVDARTFPGFFVSLPAGQTAKLVAAMYMIGGGTSILTRLSRTAAGGAPAEVLGFGSAASPLTTDTTVRTVAPAAVTLADGDYITLVTSSPTDSPLNLSFTIFIEYTK
jgi:hypothetical protein